MSYSVNVDLETLNTPGGATDCKAHRDQGPHYDVTVHPYGCQHHRAHRIESKTHYWRDFETEDAAWDFADTMVAHEGQHAAHPVLVRTCRS